jgi:cell division protein FtsZ
MSGTARSHGKKGGRRQAPGSGVTVAGVGGLGGKMVDSMIRRLGTEGAGAIRFVSANSDSQDLGRGLAPVKILLGPETSRGRGCGGRPARGRRAAEEVKDEIRKALAGTELLLIAAGMGGGTGTGAAPVVAEAAGAQDTPPVIVSLAATPFRWEIGRRKISDRAVAGLLESCDCVIAMSNAAVEDNVICSAASLVKTLEAANGFVLGHAAGLAEMLAGAAEKDDWGFEILRDFFRGAGKGFVGVADGSGDRFREAVENALASPFMAGRPPKGRARLAAGVMCGDDHLLDSSGIQAVIEMGALVERETDMRFGLQCRCYRSAALDGTGAIRAVVVAVGVSG